MAQVGDDGAEVRFHVFTGRTDAGQEDVILGEGQAMRFLTPDEIATRKLASNAHMLLAERLGTGGTRTVGTS